MFLKSSLEDKLKRSLSEYNNEPEGTKFPYLKNTRSQTFRIFHGKNEKLSFPRDHKKFNDEDVPAKAREAKNYVKNLIDPDILEIRQKRWNISSKPEFNERPELKKTLFEVSHGLKDFKVIEPKEKIVEMGTDTRNYCYEGWNGSTLLEQLEKKEISMKNLENSKVNTIRYWKKYNDLRIADSLVDLVEDTQKSPKKKIFKMYKNPISSAMELNNMLGSIKRSTSEVRDNLREVVAYENPAATQEKIEAIVFRKMYGTIRNEIMVKTGKKSPEKKIINEDQGLSETELINKIESELREKMQKEKLKEEQNKMRDSGFVNTTKGRAFSNTNYIDDRRSMQVTGKKTFQVNYKKNYNTFTDKSKPWIKYEYHHPGTFTEFVFKEKVNTQTNLANNSAKEFKEEKTYAWSCCMNDNKDSKGCERIAINRLKWNLDSIP